MRTPRPDHVGLFETPWVASTVDAIAILEHARSQIGWWAPHAHLLLTRAIFHLGGEISHHLNRPMTGIDH